MDISLSEELFMDSLEKEQDKICRMPELLLKQWPRSPGISQLAKSMLCFRLLCA